MIFEQIAMSIIGLLAAVAVLIRALFMSTVDDEEDKIEAEVEIASGTDGSPNNGRQSLDDTITAGIAAETTTDDDDADFTVKITGDAPAPLSEDNVSNPSQGRQTNEKANTINKCPHCGAVNTKSDRLCWNCGSNPRTAISQKQRQQINDDSKRNTTPDSYTVKKGESPNTIPAPSPGAQTRGPQSDQTTPQGKDNADQDLSLIQYKIAVIKNQLYRWKHLTITNSKTISLVTLATAVIWAIHFLYGSLRFEESTTMGLVAACVFGITLATLSTICLLSPNKLITAGLGYPLAVNVVLMPVLVMALYDPNLSVMWTYSDLLTTTISNLAKGYGPGIISTHSITLTNEQHVIMWFCASFPVGWAIAAVHR